MNSLKDAYTAICERKATDAATSVLLNLISDEDTPMSHRQDVLVKDYQRQAYIDHLFGAVSGLSAALILRNAKLGKAQLRLFGATLASATYLSAYTISAHYRSWRFVQEIINDPNTRLAKSMKIAFDNASST